MYKSNSSFSLERVAAAQRAHRSTACSPALSVSTVSDSIVNGRTSSVLMCSLGLREIVRESIRTGTPVGGGVSEEGVPVVASASVVVVAACVELDSDDAGGGGGGLVLSSCSGGGGELAAVVVVVVAAEVVRPRLRPMVATLLRGEMAISAELTAQPFCRGDKTPSLLRGEIVASSRALVVVVVLLVGVAAPSLLSVASSLSSPGCSCWRLVVKGVSLRFLRRIWLPCERGVPSTLTVERSSETVWLRVLVNCTLAESERSSGSAKLASDSELPVPRRRCTREWNNGRRSCAEVAMSDSGDRCAEHVMWISCMQSRIRSGTRHTWLWSSALHVPRLTERENTKSRSPGLIESHAWSDWRSDSSIVSRGSTSGVAW